MLLLTRSDIEPILTIGDTINVVEQGFAALASGQVVMPQRVATPISEHGGLHLSMPAYVTGEPGALTVKIVTVYPENPLQFGMPMIQGVLLLHDAVTGKLLAIMDAEYITAMRTGASSGVATKYMARENAHSLTLFGAGAQAAAQMEAVCAVRDIERAYVVTRTGQKDAAFAAAMSAKLGIEIRPTRDIRAAVEAASILCTATNSRIPLFDGDWLQPGAHINAVGAYKSNMRELDAKTIQRSRILVDQHTAAQTEAGDILLAIEELGDNQLTYDPIAGELGEVVVGRLAGRTDPEQITLFKSVGLAMQDAVTAAHVYALATTAGIGQTVDL